MKQDEKGRDVRTVYDLSPQDVSEDVDEIRTNILKTLDIARDALFVAAEKREVFLLQQRKDIQLPEYMRKLRMKFIEPLKILAKPSDSTVRLQFPSRFKHLKDVLYLRQLKKLLRRRGEGNRTEYLVRWEGCDDPMDDSWVRSADL
eukprot:765959-Hanusia_phi.AAC.3